MTASELRKRIKKRVDELSAERLPLADDFLAYLQDRESDEATLELLRIPGFVDELKQAESEVKRGQTTPAKQVRRKRSA